MLACDGNQVFSADCETVMLVLLNSVTGKHVQRNACTGKCENVETKR